MRWYVVQLIYRLLLPLLFIAAFPGWVLKMARRGGFKTRLWERAAIFGGDPEFEPCGAIHLHAVSVGESLLALKLIRAWRKTDPWQSFVLATGTATGHAVATQAAIPGLRVVYSPIDFRCMVRRYLDRFEPSRIILIEGEAWPHLLLDCRRRGIPVSLANARMSPRSQRRYRRCARWIGPLFQMLDAIAIQEPGDAAIWEDLGVDASKIHNTGSLKFDPTEGASPIKREEFQRILDSFGNRPVILAASTHPGEDSWIAAAIAEAQPDALPLIAPRHAERRMEVAADLVRGGFDVVFRSEWTAAFMQSSEAGRRVALVVDTTGELRDWTAHADVVVIGKSFLTAGGQNPAEAILAGKPLVFGPHMQNFEPLASRLCAAGGAIRAEDQRALVAAIRSTLDPLKADEMARNASRVLARHEGATQRMIALFSAIHPHKNG